MRPPRKRADARSGARGEALAATYLTARGYRVASRNVRTPHGEIDLLAHDGAEWVAVEVKARKDHPAPEATARPEQLDRIARSLDALARGLRPRARTLRIDVVAIRWVEPEPEVRHFRGVRRWHTGPATCGSASVHDRLPADSWNHAPVAARLLRHLRRLWQRFLRALNPDRARPRPSDGDPR